MCRSLQLETKSILSRRLAWSATCELSDHINQHQNVSCGLWCFTFSGDIATITTGHEAFDRRPSRCGPSTCFAPALRPNWGHRHSQSPNCNASSLQVQCCYVSYSAWGPVTSEWLSYMSIHNCRPRRADARAKHRAEKGKGRGRGRGNPKGKGKGRGRGRTVPPIVNELLFLL